MGFLEETVGIFPSTMLPPFRRATEGGDHAKITRGMMAFAGLPGGSGKAVGQAQDALPIYE